MEQGTDNTKHLLTVTGPSIAHFQVVSPEECQSSYTAVKYVGTGHFFQVCLFNYLAEDDSNVLLGTGPEGVMPHE